MEGWRSVREELKVEQESRLETKLQRMDLEDTRRVDFIWEAKRGIWLQFTYEDHSGRRAENGLGFNEQVKSEGREGRESCWEEIVLAQAWCNQGWKYNVAME